MAIIYLTNPGRLDDDVPPIIIVERRARQTLDRMQEADARRRAAQPDYSGEELGSIDAFVLDATTHYGRPALRIRDRLTGEKITCLIPHDVAESVGKEHDWRDVWSGQRVRVSGRIKRGVTGGISLITADNVTEIEPREVVISDVADPNFTGGKGVREYLDELWGESVGEG